MRLLLHFELFCLPWVREAGPCQEIAILKGLCTSV